MASAPPQIPEEEPHTSEPQSPVPAPDEDFPIGPNIDEPESETSNPAQTDPVWSAP